VPEHLEPLMNHRTLVAAIVLLTSSAPARPEDRPDILIADFESSEYPPGWKVDGEAFGPGPARGTLPNQMPVSGFEGARLVNTYYKGDGTTGSLTSTPFTIERRHLSFLIGGGGYPDETCLNLLVGAKVVRTAVGPNTQPGGSESLDWASWDVAEFAGQSAVVQIVDRRADGWGHINVDHIVLTDRPRGARTVRRELVVKQRYLHLPVTTGAAKRRMKLSVDGRAVREFEIEFDAERPQFWVFADVDEFRGKTLAVEARLPDATKGLDAITESDELPDAALLYREPRRPQFHFTSRRGWHNDPNGLVYFDGEWHLFYQHNPYGWNWGNMHWSHAVSRDLVHWQELGVAIYPRQFGDWAFSGSALVDANNMSGWGQGGRPPLVIAYTSTGRGECMAYSNDHGRTWTEFDGNPVVRHAGRDPKVIWHAASRRWVMAVYDEHGTDGAGKTGQHIAFYSSSDLKRWELQSRIAGYYECPDLFELSVGQAAKNDSERRWVLYAADGKYTLGDFDGRQFKPESGKHQLWYGNFYAAQTYSDAPDGRRVQIGWGQGINFPGMPFNQQMTVPVELTLHPTADGVRMFAEPVRELEALRGKKHSWADLELKAGETPLRGPAGDSLDIVAEFAPNDSDSFGLIIRGAPILYDAKAGELHVGRIAAPLKLNGKLRLRVLVDRGSIEVFAGAGRVAVSLAHPAPDNVPVLTAVTTQPSRIASLDVHELRSAWK
jgi:fructan beta-fructosidase